MSDKKNIDRFFQEQFRDFELAPDPIAWKNIKSELGKKRKKRKVIPFWMQLSGVASAFLFCFFGLYNLASSLVQQKDTIEVATKNSQNKIQEKTSVVDNAVKKTDSTTTKIFPQIVNNTTEKTKTDEKQTLRSTGFKINSNKEKNQKNSIVYFQKNNSSLKNRNSKDKIENGSTNISDLNETQQQLLKNVPKEVLANNSFHIIAKEPKLALQELNTEAQSKPETSNELEDLLTKKLEETTTVSTIAQKTKWQVTPNIAAVYLNANSGGSAIDPQFSDNEKTAQNSLSFGVGVTYAVSKKLALRSGLNKLALGYNTNNVVYSTGLSSNNLPNIAYNTKTLIKITTQKSLNSLATFEKEIQKTNTGALNQTMGYFEVPLELSYAIVDKKFGIQVIGGFSTLFLNQNKVSLVAQETTITLGKANNLNPIHFSTNLGLGFAYKIHKSFDINVEPMVKYQLNTFTNNSDAVKPFFLGLYSGVRFSF